MKIEISLRGFSDKKGTNSKFQIQTDMKNQAGDTVADIARQYGFVGIVNLLSNLREPTIKEDDGATCIISYSMPGNK